MMRRDLGSFSLFSSDVRLTVKTLLKVDQTSSMPKLNTRHFHVWFSLLLSSRPQRTHDAKNISFDTSSSLGLWETQINRHLLEVIMQFLTSLIFFRYLVFGSGEFGVVWYPVAPSRKWVIMKQLFWCNVIPRNETDFLNQGTTLFHREASFKQVQYARIAQASCRHYSQTGHIE